MTENKLINREKFVKDLNDYKQASKTIEELEVSKIKEYYRGYRAGIDTVIDMMYCKNYEQE